MPESLPEHTSVVVIGGGVMGCSTLYHLAKLGVGDVILLERKKLTSGTTWHSAAQVRQLRSTNNLTQLIRYSTELYASLQAETGQSTGWTRTGSLSIATNADRLTHIRHQASLAKLFGVETHELSGAQARELWPMMRSDDIIGAVYSPGDGRVNPSDLCAALVKGAKARGARIFEDTAVTGFRIHNDRVSGVRTAHGDIGCETVVNCAGLWGRQVGAMAGVSVPLYACEHFYLLTKPIEGLGRHLPTLSDHDGCLYIRDEVGGILAGCFEPGAKAVSLDKLPADFAFDLLDEDWDHFEPMMHNAMHRIPALAQAQVRMLVNGPESFTPDGAFILGQAAERKGFFVGCGMNSVGVASGGGAGRALAEWILQGAPTQDLWSVDIRRFAPLQANETLLRERIPEVLGLHYAIGYPGREPQTARGLRRSPIHDRLVANGAQFGTRMGWERASWFAAGQDPVPAPLGFGKPAWFDAEARESIAARNAVVLFDQSSFAKILVDGADAPALLQRLCANDVDVAPGRIVYTGMLNERGGYESDLTVMRLSRERYMLVTGTGQAIRDLDWIRDAIAPADRVSVLDVTSSLAVFSIMGPSSRRLLRGLTSEDLGNRAFPLFTNREIGLASATVRAARLSYVGELGWELYVPVDMAPALYDTLMTAGAGVGLLNAGSHALTSLRIEKGYRAWGHEVTPDDTPLEAGLGFATKMRADVPFIGRKALLEQHETGLGRRLIHFKLDDPDVFLFGDEPIRFGGDIAGQTTSAAFGHTLGTSVGMGYVELENRRLAAMIRDGVFELECASRHYPMTVSLSPFFDPSGERMRANT
jgi:glycine cleavage system aminomethyltransferase T/glycine/D-amino acid oxidase-like deaminating enzyme